MVQGRKIDYLVPPTHFTMRPYPGDALPPPVYDPEDSIALDQWRDSRLHLDYEVTKDSDDELDWESTEEDLSVQPEPLRPEDVEALNIDALLARATGASQITSGSTTETLSLLTPCSTGISLLVSRHARMVSQNTFRVLCNLNPSVPEAQLRSDSDRILFMWKSCEALASRPPTTVRKMGIFLRSELLFPWDITAISTALESPLLKGSLNWTSPIWTFPCTASSIERFADISFYFCKRPLSSGEAIFLSSCCLERPDAERLDLLASMVPSFWEDTN